MGMDLHIVIPARLQATRLPRKPLLMIKGKPMIQHVWERACESCVAQDKIWIATDSDEVMQCAHHFGAQAILTATSHGNGTERICEVAEKLGWSAHTIVINLQGDEPFFQSQHLNDVAQLLIEHPQADMSTLACTLCDERVFSTNSVKVVCDKNMRALYFSRAAIPWNRDYFSDHWIPNHGQWLQHLGVYGYRVKTLQQLQSESSCWLERTEKLEQLRALWLGLHIQVGKIPNPSHTGIDTPEDLLSAQSHF